MSARPHTVLATGCSSGIGRATAERLARGGRHVFATARNLDSIRDLEASGCDLLALDVTDEESMRFAVEEVERMAGGVDVLVNNAGYSLSGTIEETPLDEVRRQFETNVFGLVRLTQLVLPGMRSRRSGKIVNLSSMGGKLTFPGGGFYHASKHAVEAISDALRFEVRGFGIDVIVIEPGLIRTNFARTAVTSMRANTEGPYGNFTDAVARSTEGAYVGPIGRLGGEPDDVATAIEDALRRRRPPIRRPVTPSARAFLTLRRLLGDRGWDALMRRQYPSPGSDRSPTS